MAQLIIHIGLRKTGSSALQELLSKTRPLLCEYGISYPETLLKYPAHQELAWTLMNPSPAYVADLPSAEDVYTQYCDIINRNIRDGVITLLSSEDISLLSLDWLALSKLREYFGVFQPLIVFYRRSAIDYLISNYQHAVFVGRETRGFRDYAFNMYQLMFADWRVMRSIWGSVFGADCVRVLDYDSAISGTQSILGHFLDQVFDIQLADDPYTNYRSNTGVSSEATKYMLALNSSDHSDEEISLLKRSIRKMETPGSKEKFLSDHLRDDELLALQAIFR